jgi:hypothetical protein
VDEQSRAARLPATPCANLPKIRCCDRPEFVSAVGELLKAQECAADARCDIWDFAVEIATLQKIGLTDTDLRWLVSKAYVLHRLDATETDDQGRRFRTTNRLKFQQQSCFVLTNLGVSFVSRLLNSKVDRSSKLALVFESTPSQVPPKPFWDGLRRQLRVTDHIVKHFRWPAPNQERVLAAFQEDGWKSRIDDPLTPADGQQPKQRLHDTIKCLNRCQKVPLIQFYGDGTGEGVIWQFTPTAFDVLGIDIPDQEASQECG